MKASRFTVFVALMALVAFGTALAAEAEVERPFVGELTYQRDGVPFGKTKRLVSPVMVKTHSDAASLELPTGQVLNIASNSAARIIVEKDGSFHIRVVSGQITTVDESGKTRLAGKNSFFIVRGEATRR